MIEVSKRHQLRYVADAIYTSSSYTADKNYMISSNRLRTTELALPAAYVSAFISFSSGYICSSSRKYYLSENRVRLEIVAVRFLGQVET
jgi:hypothetical protein